MASGGSAAGPSENIWHREWMRRTENAYEWWYFDGVSDDGAWELVVIFLLGSPFSAYTRLCALGRRPDPLEHNGVYVALHRDGRLHHYLYARYRPDRIAASDSGALDLSFGPNRWTEGRSGSFTIALDERNANRRRIRARIDFADAQPRTPSPIDLTGGSDGHAWLPVVLGGRLSARIELFAEPMSLRPERIRFDGSAYHDHNWGTLPLTASIAQWTWARASFEAGDAAVLYSVTPKAGAPRHILLMRTGGAETLDQSPAVTAGSNGLDTRRAWTVSCESSRTGARAQWSFENALEATPFYARRAARCTLRGDGARERVGRGIGEVLRPRGMDAWLFAEAMRLRIYEPDL